MWHLISFLASINSTEYTDKNTAIYVSAMSSTRTDSEWLIVPPNFLNACSSLPTVSALKVYKGQLSSKTSTLSWELTSLPDFIWFIQHYESVCIRWSCHTGIWALVSTCDDMSHFLVHPSCVCVWGLDLPVFFVATVANDSDICVFCKLFITFSTFHHITKWSAIITSIKLLKTASYTNMLLPNTIN